MTYANPDALVDGEWLAGHLDDPRVRIADATFFLPDAGRDARIEFELRHIPGAVFFDIDEISTASELPHMLPDTATFSAKVGALGIGSEHRIVVYDALGGYSAAARAWWMFRGFGHPDVAVLVGGLPRWIKEGRPVDKGIPEPKAAEFAASENKGMARALDEMLANLESGDEQVLDARSPGRFAGTDPEPRPTRRVGHIPGSLNLPFGSILDKDADFAFRPGHEIAAAFAAAGVDLARPIVATCGSGVTAAVLSLGLYLLGHEGVPVYDGSWAEWGNRDDTPVDG